MQIGQPLIVKSLRLGRRSSDRFINPADSLPQRYRALKQSESYESCAAGLLARRTRRDLAPLILELLQENGVLDTSDNIALRVGRAGG